MIRDILMRIRHILIELEFVIPIHKGWESHVQPTSPFEHLLMGQAFHPSTQKVHVQKEHFSWSQCGVGALMPHPPV